uniref:Uncharacterized protein n=1 Tax=Molossus molossus TaxID=27622 RepID=A0A7J8GQL7_MOLMO|nr:hypothetical protein HJG59_011256 [Molossus molossus]
MQTWPFAPASSLLAAPPPPPREPHQGCSGTVSAAAWPGPALLSAQSPPCCVPGSGSWCSHICGVLPWLAGKPPGAGSWALLRGSQGSFASRHEDTLVVCVQGAVTDGIAGQAVSCESRLQGKPQVRVSLPLPLPLPLP